MATRKRAPFVLFKRKGKDGADYYCARFKDDDGLIVRTITLKSGGKTAAALEARKLLDDGVVGRDDDPLVLAYVRDFWSANSDYIKGRAKRGVNISDAYIDENRRLVEQVFTSALKGSRMTTIRAAKVESAILKAADERGRRTANKALQAIKVPVNHWCKHNRIFNPLSLVEKVDEETQERGVLTTGEVRAILDLEGQSPRVKAAVLLAALCGLRLGEAMGLQWEDVDEEAHVLHVRHNTPVHTTAIKPPKWDSKRDVPMPTDVAEALSMVRATAPVVSAFVLYNQHDASRPIADKTITEGYYRILRRIGIDEPARKARNLTYHGLRHFYVSFSRSAGIPDFVVQRYAGHRSAAMQERYSHPDIIDLGDARKRLDNQLVEKPEEAAREETGRA